MKTLLTLLLVTTSSIAMANGYYQLSETEMWRDSPTTNSFSDSRYRTRYSPSQIQAYTDQRNAEVIKRSKVELEKQDIHSREMSQYYSAQRASRQYLGMDNQPSFGTNGYRNPVYPTRGYWPGRNLPAPYPYSLYPR